MSFVREVTVIEISRDVKYNSTLIKVPECVNALFHTFNTVVKIVTLTI